MKALGTGLGAFALTDVEVRRAAGTGAGTAAPRRLVLHGGAAGAGRRRQAAADFHLSLDPHERRWPSPSSWPNGSRRVLPRPDPGRDAGRRRRRRWPR